MTTYLSISATTAEKIIVPHHCNPLLYKILGKKINRLNTYLLVATKKIYRKCYYR